MKRNTKLAAVFTTAALLAFGASMSSMAAEKGTWKMDGNDWMCYDKNGDVYESTFCESNGKDYYVGDDGYMVRSSWVDYDGDLYYVNSAGQKVTNDWKLVSPFEDEDADEEWFYFQSSGKAAKSKKMRINDKTYYFDENGQMLTGWVSVNGDVVSEANGFTEDQTFFTDETGARVEKSWIKTTPADADEDDEDEFWFYIKSNGKPALGKQSNINGQTYFFNNDAEMQTGWVALESGEYLTVDDKDLNELKTTDVYFCGGEDDGHAKKDKWVKTWNPKQFDDEDADNDQYWYFLEKDGKVFIPSAKGTDAHKIKLIDGHYTQKDLTDLTSKKINSKDYYFNADGEMVSGFYLLNDKDMIYLGGSSDGAMKTGSFTANDDNDESFKFYFETKTDSDEGLVKGHGISGNKNGKLYFKGQLVTAEDNKYEIVNLDNTHYYIVNASGTIQTSNKEYTEDGTTLFDAEKVKFDKSSGYNKGSFTSTDFSLLGGKADIDAAKDYLIK